MARSLLQSQNNLAHARNNPRCAPDPLGHGSGGTDLLVGDIYGGACEALGLPFDIIAASFGKAVPQGSSEQPEGNPGAQRAVDVPPLQPFGCVKSL